MTGTTSLSAADLQRLNEIANRAYEDLGDIPTTSDLERLIRSFSEMADLVSAVTYELLHPEEFQDLVTGVGQ